METTIRRPTVTPVPLDHDPRLSSPSLLNRILKDIDGPASSFMEAKFYRSGSYGMSTNVQVTVDDGVDVVVHLDSSARQIYEKQVARRIFHALAERLCEEHQAVSIDRGIFGGTPHLKGLRLSVGNILADLYVHGSIKEVQKIYAPDVTEEQIKEAIAYAQDFLEEACATR